MAIAVRKTLKLPDVDKLHVISARQLDRSTHFARRERAADGLHAQAEVISKVAPCHGQNKALSAQCTLPSASRMPAGSRRQVRWRYAYRADDNSWPSSQTTGMHCRVPCIGRVSGLSEVGLVAHINRNPKLAVPIAPNLDTWWDPETGSSSD